MPEPMPSPPVPSPSRRPPAAASRATLVPWARIAARRHGSTPTLWLFTDSRRLPDPRPAALRLPPRMAGIVFRHDDHPDRAAIGRDLARICRVRHLALVVAGDVRLAVRLGAGVHLRGGRWPGPLRRRRGVITSSAHSRPDILRAERNGAVLAFLSPVFSTRSHPGDPTLGAVRWTAVARAAPIAVGALGGISGRTVRRLPRCRIVGAIDSLA
ncbi:MAG: thiamine phosphate synthase [Acetobacteraceae bacterium]